MKIILSAFNGKLKSQPMDVPDNTSPDWYMPMDMDILAYNSDKNVFDTVDISKKRGHFQRTNYSYHAKDLGIETPKHPKTHSNDEFVYEYKLTDIS